VGGVAILEKVQGRGGNGANYKPENGPVFPSKLSAVSWKGKTV